MVAEQGSGTGLANFGIPIVPMVVHSMVLKPMVVIGKSIEQPSLG